MEQEVKMCGIDKLIKALMLVKPFMNDYHRDYPTHCEHDVMYLCVEVEKLTPEIVQELETLRFFYSEDDEGFKSYHFGESLIMQNEEVSNCEHYVFVKMSKYADRGYGPYPANQAEYFQRRFAEDGFDAEVAEVTGYYE